MVEWYAEWVSELQKYICKFEYSWIAIAYIYGNMSYIYIPEKWQEAMGPPSSNN